jgi:hypothetical protein
MDSKMQKELTKQLSVARQTSVDMARRHELELQRAEEAVALATDVARVAKEEYTRLDRIFARGQSQSRNYMKKGKLKKGKYIRGSVKDMRFPGAVEQEREAKAQWNIMYDANNKLAKAKLDLRRLNEKTSSSPRSARPAAATGMTVAAGEDLLKSLVADTRGPRHQTFWPRGATRKKKSRRSKRRSTKRRRTRRSRKGSTKHRRHSRKRSTKRRRRSRRSRHSHRRRS